ncbi:MAG: tRNA preQ1(34) S-adenosylmethionine ribosyltransferase-isomerase QueA [Candidatus Omnitrophica bacterium]|nr:tRNA preQ1(34) S-adenosylmethionine ribosyltransferase-isomerase QueA [Candidatus Omnitrophota bacterium]
MKLEDFNYQLPKELIAQFPKEKREEARLLVLERKTGRIIHRIFREIVDYLNPGDTVVLNDTQVIPARLWGVREKTKGKIEVFLLEKKDESTFSVLFKSRGKFSEGERVIFKDNLLSGIILSKDEDGLRLFKFEEKEDLLWEKLNKIGEIPLPPYIKRKPLELDKERYQTVYAKKEGAVAAPTAGLHFTKELLEKIKEKGVNIVYVTLHINYATFNPVKEENIEEHKMYKEYYEFPEETAQIITETRKKGKKILAVGTTSCRVLETVANISSQHQSNLNLSAHSGLTDLFIYPPYNFKLTDMLLTNFHFPKSTLLMLVAAFCGSDIWKKAYQEAIKERYRFYSYGDAMLVI